MLRGLSNEVGVTHSYFEEVSPRYSSYVKSLALGTLLQTGEELFLILSSDSYQYFTILRLLIYYAQHSGKYDQDWVL